MQRVKESILLLFQEIILKHNNLEPNLFIDLLYFAEVSYLCRHKSYGHWFDAAYLFCVFFDGGNAAGAGHPRDVQTHLLHRITAWKKHESVKVHRSLYLLRLQKGWAHSIKVRPQYKISSAPCFIIVPPPLPVFLVSYSFNILPVWILI